MAKVQFKSNVPNHTRELSVADLRKLGVEGEDVKKFSLRSGEVSDDLSDGLVKALVELGEFEVVKDDAEGEPLEQATSLQDTVPDGEQDNAGGSSTGANTRDGAGARTARTR